jgi:pyruvate/2-oxoglutarate dehydrogenase complex dihydrolipoamide dehydrogenase (E3) component
MRRTSAGASQANFAAVMERRIRTRLAERTSADRLTAIGIDLYSGDARFAGRDLVTIGDRELRFKKALIATGARAVRPLLALIAADLEVAERDLSTAPPPAR